MSTRLDTKSENLKVLLGVTLPTETFQLPQRKTSSSSIGDLDSAFAEALSSPIDYPPIHESVFPGDQVAIALQAKLPQPAKIVQSLAHQLQDIDFVVVCSPETAERLGGTEDSIIKIVVHDPSDQNTLSMMGIDDKAAPVYINRILFDADVVIPVGFPVSINETESDCIYPYYSGVTEQDQFEERSAKSRAGQVRLANSQLGAFWVIQLVIGPGGNVHHVFVGERGETIHQAKQSANEVWKVEIDSDSELVLATIESDKSLQSWDDFCSALISADQVARSGAPIVICSEISANPPRKIKTALTQQFEARVAAKLNSIHQRVAEIASERNIFLSSGLGQTKTEELGLGHINGADELQRIIDRHPNGILLRDAHRCNVQKTG